MSLRDPASRRRNMVRTQLRGRRIQDPKTLRAMGRVPREKFIPEAHRDLAYDDRPVSIGEDQTVSQPFMVALMTQALELTGRETVLEVGSGSGYQTAVLAEIVKMVYSVERIPALAQRAARTLKELGYTNARVTVGDGTLGDPEHAPFDAILVTAGSPRVPDPLLQQLADGGRLVIPVGGRSYQELQRIRRHGGSYRTEELGGCVFVPLIGRGAWTEDPSEEGARDRGAEAR